MNSAVHVEIPVKVNAFVDEGIANLIEALSNIPTLVTLESCQGGDGRDAFVTFHLGSWRDAGVFLYDELLPVMTPSLRAVCSLTIQAYDTDHAQATISIEAGAVNQLVECINVVSTKICVKDSQKAA